MRVRRSDQLPVSIQTEENSREITLWNRQIEGHPDQLCCDALRHKELKSEIHSMFQAYVDGYLPLDNPPQVSLPLDLSFDVQIDQTGKIPPKWAVPLSVFPNKFQNLASSTQHELSEDAKTFVKTLRWRQGSTGTQSPFAHVGFDFSFDREKWYPMPHSVCARILETKAIDADQIVLEQTKTLWVAGEREPLGHELVREALDINLSNPRSSLMMAVSALETGLKTHISHCVPNSNIIMEKLPSPPALTLLQDIVPSIHKAVGIDDRYFPLSSDSKKFVQKWIVQRNQIAHGTKQIVDSQETEKFIRFVRSTLYALDACRGHRWAEQYVRGEEFLF